MEPSEVSAMFCTSSAMFLAWALMARRWIVFMLKTFQKYIIQACSAASPSGDHNSLNSMGASIGNGNAKHKIRLTLGL